MRPPSSAAEWPAGRWPTTSSTGRPSAAAWAGRIPVRSCGWSTRRGRPRPGRHGLLEVIPAQMSSMREWMRTTDLARIDADGFVWILGPGRPGHHPWWLQGDARRCAHRAGEPPRGARRGGHRQPDDRARRDPGRDGRTARPGVGTADSVGVPGTRLARYEIPTEIAIVEAIPRTPSGKADLTAVRSELHRGMTPVPRTVAGLLRTESRPGGVGATNSVPMTRRFHRRVAILGRVARREHDNARLTSSIGSARPNRYPEPADSPPRTPIGLNLSSIPSAITSSPSVPHNAITCGTTPGPGRKWRPPPDSGRA